MNNVRLQKNHLPCAFSHALFICLRKPNRKSFSACLKPHSASQKPCCASQKNCCAGRKNSGPPNLNSDASNLNYMARSFYEMPCCFFEALSKKSDRLYSSRSLVFNNPAKSLFLLCSLFCILCLGLPIFFEELLAASFHACGKFLRSLFSSSLIFGRSISVGITL